MTQPPDDWNEDEDHDPPRLCFYSGSYCDRAFCDDYGCADEAGAVGVEPGEATMSDEMIQRVARALCALDCKAASGILGSEDLCIFGECSRWGDNTGHARAAIEAMREPTEYMLSTALGDGAWCTANSWRAMIDAALGAPGGWRSAG